MNSIPSIHDGYILNYSDFICSPEKCSMKQNTIAFRLPRPPALTRYIGSNCLLACDWFSEVLTQKPQSKQTTTVLNQKSRFFSTKILRVLTNFGEFVLPQYLDTAYNTVDFFRGSNFKINKALNKKQ